MNAKLFIRLQYLVPQHALSRAAGWLASTKNTLIKNTFIRWFVKRYQVDMSLALEQNPLAYSCFNDFFTRALNADARPIDSNIESIVSPADGAFSQLGDIIDGRIFQAKGQEYTAQELLGGDSDLAAEFTGGTFATVYLSPRDYHRVHMPYSGKLRAMISVPGELFSVNAVTAENVPRLFARNERVAAIFDTDIGPMAVILVGAMIVAGIETVWDGQIAPFASREIATSLYPYQSIILNKGDEMGRFKLGSTAIVLFANNKMQWDKKFSAGTSTKMGEAIGKKN
jgi:phosphatidylserine decarboxylase